MTVLGADEACKSLSIWVPEFLVFRVGGREPRCSKSKDALVSRLK